MAKKLKQLEQEGLVTRRAVYEMEIFVGLSKNMD